MNGFRKLWDRVLKVAVVAIATGAGVLVCAWVLHRAGKLQSLELSAYDTMLRLHLQPTELGAANDIVIVGVDEFDIRLLKHSSLFDAEKLAILQTLEDAKPKAIGLDIYVDIPSGSEVDKTQELCKFIATNRNIVCGYQVGTGTIDKPDVRQAMGPVEGSRLTGRRVAVVDQPYDYEDSVCRRGLLYETDSQTSTHASQSLSLGVANVFLESTGVLQRPTDVNDLLHIDSFWQHKLRRFSGNDGAYVGVEDSGFQYLVDHRGPAKFPIYRMRQIYPFKAEDLDNLPDSARLPRVADPSVFRDKIVLVGMTTTVIKDYIFTPLDRVWGHFGVEQHALLADQLIRTARDGSQPLRVWSSGAFWSWTTLWAMLGTMAGLSARIGYSPRAPWRLIVIGIVGELTVLGISALLFAKGTWVPMVPPSICWVATISIVGAYISQLERTDRNVLNNLFVKICHAEIATELWKRRDEILADGKLRPKR